MEGKVLGHWCFPPRRCPQLVPADCPQVQSDRRSRLAAGKDQNRPAGGRLPLAGPLAV